MFTIRPQDFESEMARYARQLCATRLIALQTEPLLKAHNQKPPQSQAQAQPLGCIALHPLCLNGQLDALPASPSQPKLDSSGNDGDAGASGSYAKPKYCELKRLYVTPSAQGWGVGKALVKVILDIAREIGYEEVMLDTLPDMREAINMFSGMGFGVVEKYYEKAIEGTVFLRLKL
ncbi:hypothetical protein PAAG_06044 [Paracoccidioides lutzii Pb01]|uniref:N-acetyltransferase domain-containing protein n=1 Tax=Paracoccidioides lutzii (strain ATCC MYA-826 / Pb01) TaxID=502779 RepID=C1H5K3_PARBA|nr:hypothetical protein PAAG_06044 [Paracoccidioides lutzii Pb01]EEH34997.2 hypothetical protein PAAG_06044 [Paracoccidioides lutzii Pb01]